MGYNPDNAVERKVPEAGMVIEAVIIDIKDGQVRDFITKPEALKKFKVPNATAIQVTSECKFDGKVYRSETLFSYDMDSQNRMSFDAKSSLASFKKLYGGLPKTGQIVKHIANANGYFKLMVKV